MIIGHAGKNGLVIDFTTAFTVDSGTSYLLAIALQGTSANVTIDGSNAVAYVFNSILNDAEFGLFTSGGSSTFDDVVGGGGDPAYPRGGGGERLVGAGAPAGGPGEAVNPRQPGPIVDGANRRRAASGVLNHGGWEGGSAGEGGEKGGTREVKEPVRRGEGEGGGKKGGRRGKGRRGKKRRERR